MDTSLTSTVKEETRRTLSPGIANGHTVLHLAFTVHLCTSNASADERVHTTLVIFVGSPPVGFVYEDIVVVSETIPHANICIGITDIILNLRRKFGIIADSIGVDIVETEGT